MDFSAVLLYIFGFFMTIVMLLLYIIRQKSTLIFDLYPSKGLFYQIKYKLALILLKNLRLKIYDPTKGTINIQQLEETQILSSHPASYDVVSFIGANKSGQNLLLVLERRRRGVIKACMYIWLPEEGLLCSTKLPDMLYFTTDGKNENNEFRGGGFHIYVEESMQKWRICYYGTLRKVRTDEIVDVNLNLSFKSTLKHFDYNRDLSSAVIADSVAREAWNDDFFNMLRIVDQILEKRTHYEQVGSITGELEINKKYMNLNLRGFRDHNFGTERCLSQINRYVYIVLFLDNDVTLVLGNVSQPTFFLSSLKIGYICTAEGEYHPITYSNFELYTYGEKGTPPVHQNFIVSTAEEKYFVQIQVFQTAIRYVGGNWDSKIFNQFVKCQVNGISGNGITEFLYKHKEGRPEIINKTDPQWYQRVRIFERSLSTGNFLDDDDEHEFIF